MVDRGELYSAPYSQKREASLTDIAIAAELAQVLGLYFYD